MEWFSLLEGGEPVGSPALSSLLMDAWLGYQRTVGPWGICQDSHGWHITASTVEMNKPKRIDKKPERIDKQQRMSTCVAIAHPSKAHWWPRVI